MFLLHFIWLVSFVKGDAQRRSGFTKFAEGKFCEADCYAKSRRALHNNRVKPFLRWCESQQGFRTNLVYLRNLIHF